MNAPDSHHVLRDEAGTAPDLVAWAMIRRLVAFDTTSRESNLALIDWVRDYLEGYGAQCWLTFDDPDALFAEVEAYAQRFLPEMRAVAADACIEFDLLSASPGFDTRGESGIAALGAACNGTEGHGKVSFGTEASLCHDAAIPALICGPGHIAQVHQPNEWVAVEQLARCEAFMRNLADRVCLA